MFELAQVDTPLRFDLQKFMEFDSKLEAFDVLDSAFIYRLEKAVASGEFIVREEEMKPDLLSYRIYGVTQFWWILLAFNGIYTYETLETGTIIKYPALKTMEEIYFTLAPND